MYGLVINRVIASRQQVQTGVRAQAGAARINARLVQPGLGLGCLGAGCGASRLQ